MKIVDQEKIDKKMMKRLDDIWYYLKSQPSVVNITINNINQPTHIFNDVIIHVIVKSLHMKNLTKLVEELGYSVNRKTKPYVWNIKSI